MTSRVVGLLPVQCTMTFAPSLLHRASTEKSPLHPIANAARQCASAAAFSVRVGAHAGEGGGGGGAQRQWREFSLPFLFSPAPSAPMESAPCGTRRRRQRERKAKKRKAGDGSGEGSPPKGARTEPTLIPESPGPLRSPAPGSHSPFFPPLPLTPSPSIAHTNAFRSLMPP